MRISDWSSDVCSSDLERRRTTMKKMVTLSIAALMSTATLGLATPAAAQNGYYDRDGYSSYDARYNRDNRRYDRRDNRSYRSNDRRDYRNYDRRAIGKPRCRERVCQHV